jgi:hypothetical protein
MMPTRHVDGFIASLNQELSQRVSNSRQATSNTLMPVIQINSLGCRRTPEGRGG